MKLILLTLGSRIRLLPELQDELKMKLIKTESYNGIVDLFMNEDDFRKIKTQGGVEQ